MTKKIILTSVLGALLSGCFGGENSGSSGGSIMRAISQAVSNIGKLKLKPGNFVSQSSATISEEASFTANFTDQTPDQLTTNLADFRKGLRSISPRAFNSKTDVVEFFGGTLTVDTSKLPFSTYLSFVVFGNTSMDPAYATGTTDEAGVINVQLSSMHTLSIGNLIAQSKAGQASSINISTNETSSRYIAWNTAIVENTTITFKENTYLEMASYFENPTAIYATALDNGGIISHAHSDFRIPTNFTLMLKSDSAKLDLGTKKLTNQGAIILTNGTITADSVECKPYGDFLTAPFLKAVQSSVALKENFLQPTIEWQTFGSKLYGSDLAFQGFFFMSGGNITGTLTGNRLSFLFGGILDQSFTNNGFVFMSNSTTAMKNALSNQLSSLNISPTNPDYQLVSVVNEVVGLMENSTPTLKTTTNNGVFLMSGGTTDTFTNNGIMGVDGGNFSATLINKGTLSVTGKDNDLFASIQKVTGDKIPTAYKPLLQAFVPQADPVFKDITNSGTLIIDGGKFGNVHNNAGSVFVFGGAQLNKGLSSGDVSTRDLTFDATSKAILVTGHTLKTGSINVTGSPTLTFAITDNHTAELLNAGSNNINLGSARISVIFRNTKVIPSGTSITLAKTTGTLSFTGQFSESDEMSFTGTYTNKFKHKYDDKNISLVALNNIASHSAGVAFSKTISAGGFKSHKAGKLVGATQSSFAGATFSLNGDLNVSNGFNANNAQVQMNLENTTFESNFTKTAGMDLTGTFNVFNSMDVAGFTLTNSASFATKNDSNVARFNEMGFMTGVSKNLGFGDFAFTPSVSVGFAKLSDVSANVDGYSVQGASAGAYVADLSLDAGHAFKVAGLAMNVSGGISFGFKSAQTFELHNAAGQTMNGIISNKNVGLNVGFSAKVDAKTSFYANAKTASYNNAKALEVGFKF